MPTIRRKKFRISNGDDWEEVQGSVGYSFPLYIHRRAGRRLWTVSHIPTGYSIRRQLSLADGRRLIKNIKDHPLFLMPCIETWNRQMAIYKKKDPDGFERLTVTIRDANSPSIERQRIF